MLKSKRNMAETKPSTTNGERKRAWTEVRVALQRALQSSTQRSYSAKSGISTATIQRIIKTKEKPWFEPEKSSPTARKEWARIISAIAADAGVSDQQRREWLRLLGLPYDSTMDEKTRRDLARRSSYDGDDTIAAVRASGKLRVGVMVFPPFSGSEPAQRSFLHSYARPLLMAIFPFATLDVSNLYNPQEAIEMMVRPIPDLDVVVGLLDSIPRRMRGLDFIPIPHLYSPLGARWIGKRGSAPPDLETPDAPIQRTTIAVISRETGHLLLKGALNYAPLVEIPESEIVSSLEELDGQEHDGGLLFVADETICRTLDKNHSSLVVSAADLPALSSVSYKVSIATRATSSRLRDLVRQSVTETMEDALWSYTGRLYSRLIQQMRDFKMGTAIQAELAQYLARKKGKEEHS